MIDTNVELLIPESCMKIGEGSLNYIIEAGLNKIIESYILPKW